MLFYGGKNMKITDKLTGEELEHGGIRALCTNPSVESDNYYYGHELYDHEATKIMSLEQLTYVCYQVFALFNDGRTDGAVWFPVNVSE